MNRLRYIAVHEAAHVVAYCHLGEGIVDAWLKPGRERGLVTRLAVVNTAETIMLVLAGTYAEARYRRKMVVECALEGDVAITKPRLTLPGRWVSAMGRSGTRSCDRLSATLKSSSVCRKYGGRLRLSPTC